MTIVDDGDTEESHRITTHTLETAEVDFAYDVFGPPRVADSGSALSMIGLPSTGP